jgi:hypothetical protein
MPATLADLITQVSSMIDSIVPLTFVGLVAAFGAIVGAGAVLIKRYSKALR